MSEARRLFASPLRPGRHALGADATRHALVLRLGVGDALTLFDGRGAEARAVIVEHDARGLVVDVGDVDRAADDGARRVVLVQACPKGSKLDEIVRAATECGVAAIHVASSTRSVVRLDAARERTRLERLERIAQEAARQSERATVPAIRLFASLDDAVRDAPDDAARLVLSPRDGAPWAGLVEGAREAWVAVGPEGGLSPDEEARLVASGWARARLALPVLRVETAAPVAVAMVRDRGRGAGAEGPDGRG